jgi:hypothetical protein
MKRRLPLGSSLIAGLLLVSFFATVFAEKIKIPQLFGANQSNCQQLSNFVGSLPDKEVLFSLEGEKQIFVVEITPQEMLILDSTGGASLIDLLSGTSGNAPIEQVQDSCKSTLQLLQQTHNTVEGDVI